MQPLTLPSTTTERVDRLVNWLVLPSIDDKRGGALSAMRYYQPFRSPDPNSPPV